MYKLALYSNGVEYASHYIPIFEKSIVMALIQISNQSTKSLGKKSTIRFTQSICPDCNMILDAEVFERDQQVFMSKICPTHGECEELYFGSYDMYKKFSTYWVDGKGAHAPNAVSYTHLTLPTIYSV